VGGSFWIVCGGFGKPYLAKRRASAAGRVNTDVGWKRLLSPLQPIVDANWPSVEGQEGTAFYFINERSGLNMEHVLGPSGTRFRGESV